MNIKTATAVGLCTLFGMGAAKAAEPIDPTHDYHSFSNPKELMVEHVDLAVQVDFDLKMLDGVVDLKVRRVDPAARTLILDTRDLAIREVALVHANGRDEKVPFRFGAFDKALGTPLEITLPQSLDAFTTPPAEKSGQQGGSIMVRVSYHTRPEASGLQWLKPEQTAGRKKPFLFTQSQAIHARSWIPLQDTPSVRVTYRATIFPPEGLVAAMSAARDEKKGGDADFEFEFEMTRPIPSYLIALAVGDLKFKPLGPRTGVYAEPSVLEAAAHEFADTEAMLKKCEELFGQYYWDRYDLLILPPSFPFGGMENPRLSFITPTIIAGDRSLVSLVAHEMAHSWSGNMVTNATWRDFWLNEGFTVYLEARIVEALYGEQRRAMEEVLGLQALREDLAKFPPNDQMLAIDLRGRDPDDAFSNIPYEKGRLFLVYLENKFGKDRFHNFLGNYFARFAFKSVTTEQFLDYLRKELMEKKKGAITEENIQQWVYQPGLPQDAILPKMDVFKHVDEQRAAWLAARKQPGELGAAQWSTQEWLHFLDNMPPTLTAEQMKALDDAFKFTDTGNAEVAHSWLMLVVKNRYEPGMARLEKYLMTIGRRKLVQPLYEELMKSDWGREYAKRVYEKARPGYHPISVNTFDGIVLGKGT